jgi:hypothetical protein
MAYESSEAKETINDFCAAVYDAAKYLGDVSYAVLPREIAHNLGELKKSFLGVVRTAVDKEINWIDERVAGGDKLREEWRQKCAENKANEAGEPVN